MIRLPDHVGHDVDFDHFGVEDAGRRVAALSAVCADAKLRSDDGGSFGLEACGVTINVFAQKPKLSIVYIRRDGMSNARFSLVTPYDDAVFEGIRNDPSKGLANLLATWNEILSTAPIRLLEGSAMRGVLEMDRLSADVDATMDRALRRVATLIDMHNPSRHERSTIVLRPDCMARPGAIQDDRGKPLLASALERSILSAVPNVARIHRTEPNIYEIGPHRMQDHHRDLRPQGMPETMRLLAGLPETDKPLLKAAMGTGA